MAFLSSFYPQPVVPNAIEVTASGSTTARALANRFAERVNVLDFGADPTGVAGSRNAFIAAIAAAPNGGDVYIPRGTYTGIYGIDIAKSITLIGDGDSSTILDTANIGSWIFRLLTGCDRFVCKGMKIQWEGGYTATANGGSRCIMNDFGVSSQNLEVFVDGCTFRNFSESITLWREKAKRLEVTNCKFAYKHGYASCRFPSGGPTNNIYTSPSVGWTVIGNAQTTILKNNEWNGLEDPTFTGAVAGLFEWVYTPIDNFYKGSGRAFDLLVISDNVIKNFGIEGITVDRFPYAMGTWENNALEAYNSKAVIHNNTFIGPEKVSIASRGVTPAINIYVSNKVDIRNNYINGAYEGISLHGVEYFASVNASANTLTYDTLTDGSQFLFDVFQNGKIIYLTYLPESHGTGLTLNVPYYIRNVQARAGNTVTFQLSTTPTGSIVDILANATYMRLMMEGEWKSRKIVVANNTILNCVNGIVTTSGITSNHCVIENNHIVCASEPAKTAAGYYSNDTTQNPPPAYTDLKPINLRGSVTLRNNYLAIEEPAWDGVFTLVSRSGVSNNIMTLASGQVAAMAAAAKQATLDGNLFTDYGFFQVWNANGNKSFRWPIESINAGNNTVQVLAGWATNGGADTYTSGPLYWTKTIANGSGSAYLPAIYNEATTDQTTYSSGDVIENCVLDVRSFGFTYGDVIMEGTKIRSLKAGLFTDPQITRLLEFSEVKLYRGGGIPSVSAPDGSLYLRTDGDASTSLYVCASGAWAPLASWNP